MDGLNYSDVENSLRSSFMAADEQNVSYDRPINFTYSSAHVIILCVVVICLILVIVIGNAIVVGTIVFNQKRKPVQNLFIASLAVSDLLVGILIMPFSLANELLGYWCFGVVLCELWLAFDVLLCTASILNLCLISLDRYWSIKRPMTYARRRTKRRALTMIAVVWLLAMCICFPPLAGWKHPQPHQNGLPLCVLSSEVGYVIYSTLGSFYIPLFVMVTVYIKIYTVVRSRVRQKFSASQRRVDDETKQTTFSYVGEEAHLAVRSEANDGRTGGDVDQNSLRVDVETPAKGIDETSKLLSPESACNMACQCAPPNSCPSQITVPDNDVMTETQGTQTAVYSEDIPSHQGRSNTSRRANSVVISGTASRWQTVKRYSSAGLKSFRNPRMSLISLDQMERKRSLSVTMGTAEHRKLRIARARERKLTLILGLIMVAFVLCWFPFFSTYLVTSLFALSISQTVFTVFFWAGYCNSALNPIIYTIFNRDIRLCRGRY